jgi:monofunctional biosynthetic peptidoglycan transglycosylase
MRRIQAPTHSDRALPGDVTNPPTGRLRKLRRVVFIAAVALLVVPILLVLPLNFMQPPTTAFILERGVERLFRGEHPVYPRRQLVPADRISPYLRRAVLAAEDERFFLHNGFDFTEIGKAVEKAREGGRLRGASTITQQVAKNLFLWEGGSFFRKGIEAYLTVLLEVCLSKERILAIYLNNVELGDGIFGAEAAARRWFHKSAATLSPDQAARLAAILPSPQRWSPMGSIASRRAEFILQRMQYAVPRP